MIIRRLPPHLCAVFICALAVIWLTYPAVTRLNTHLIGHPFGDQREYVSLIVHYARAVQTGVSPFILPAYVHPRGLDATLLWSIPLQSFPAWALALFLPPAAAFNLSLLTFLILNGWAMFALAYHGLLRDQPGRFLPALIGALIFTCAPAIQGQVGAAHIGLIALFPAPLLTLALLRQRAPGRRWIVIGGVTAAASLWGSLLLVVYITVPIALTVGLAALARRDWPHLRRIALTSVVGALCAAAFVLPFSLSSDPPTAEIGGAVRFSAPLTGIIAPSFYHPLYSGFEYNRRALGVDPFEGASYPGIAVFILSAAALLRARAARPWLIAGLIAWVLSLGPLLRISEAPLRVTIAGHSTFIPLPYVLIEGLPLISQTRTPARFNLFLALAAAVVGVYGAAAMRHALVRSGPIVLAALTIAIPLDTRWFWDLPLTEAAIPQAVYDLAARTDVRAVFDIPWSHPMTDKDAMYLQTAHGHPILGGHVARATPLDPAQGWLLENTLDPALLTTAGVDIVIVHRQWADADGILEGRARARLGEPSYADAQIALFAVPNSSIPALLRWHGRFDGRDLVIDLYARGLGWRSLRVHAPPCPRDPDPSLYCPPVD